MVIVRELLADFGRQELENGENAGDGPGKDLFDRSVVSVAMIRVGNEGDRQMVDWEKEYEYCNDTGMSVGAGMFFYFFKICQ